MSEGDRNLKSSQGMKRPTGPDFMRRYILQALQEKNRIDSSWLAEHVKKNGVPNAHGSLSFGVKPKEAQERLPEQTTSDATILQPKSPGRIESPHGILTSLGPFNPRLSKDGHQKIVEIVNAAYKDRIAKYRVLDEDVHSNYPRAIASKVAENLKNATFLIGTVDENSDELRKNPEKRLYIRESEQGLREFWEKQGISPQDVSTMVKEGVESGMDLEEIQIMYQSVQKTIDILKSNPENYTKSHDIEKTREFLYDYAKRTAWIRSSSIKEGKSEEEIQRWLKIGRKIYLENYKELLEKTLAKNATEPKS